jgi:3-hydroxy-9,10-secoandrosta-1,3,5(10)-triene-9,17-dione monooxygenase reductase component
VNPIVEQRLFRQALGQFATGVTVISFLRDGEICGMTVNSFCSVSLDPPLVLFCPALTTRFALEARPDERFTVSVLAQDQQDVCWHYAGRGGLEREAWQDEEAPPTVQGCLGWFRCATRAVHTHGDHLVVIGEVSQFGTHSDRAPLLFFRGGYPMLKEDGEKVSLSSGETSKQEEIS